MGMCNFWLITKSRFLYFGLKIVDFFILFWRCHFWLIFKFFMSQKWSIYPTVPCWLVLNLLVCEIDIRSSFSRMSKFCFTTIIEPDWFAILYLGLTLFHHGRIFAKGSGHHASKRSL